MYVKGVKAGHPLPWHSNYPYVSCRITVNFRIPVSASGKYAIKEISCLECRFAWQVYYPEFLPAVRSRQS